MQRLLSILVLAITSSLCSLGQGYESFKKPEYRLNNLGIKVNRDSSKIVEAKFLDDQWYTPSSVAGMTFNPKDKTLWLVMFDEDSVLHMSLNGSRIHGSFKVEKEMGIEAITIDSTDDSFWMADILGKRIVHYSKDGKLFPDGFDIELTDRNEPLGIAYEAGNKSSPNGSLWVLDCIGGEVCHYSVEGEKLNDSFNVLSLGCVNGRGLHYNIENQSFYILNNGPQEVIHVDKKGKELYGSFIINDKNVWGLVDAIAYDSESNTFWVAEYNAPCTLFHIAPLIRGEKD